MLQRIFLLLFFPLFSCGQTTTSFFFPPALEFVLPKSEWKKQGLSYDEAMWTPSIKKLVNSKKGIVIDLNCDIVQYLDISPDSIFVESEREFKYKDVHFSKERIHGFTLYSIKNDDKNSAPFYYSVVAIHPEGYFISMNITVTNLSKKESDSEVRSILSNANILSPKQIDQKVGLPMSANINRDSLFKARIAKIRNEYKKYYNSSQLEEELSKLKPDDIIPEAYNNFSYEKTYLISKNVLTGNLSLDETLDLGLLDKSSADLKYYEKYIGGIHGEYMKSIPIAMKRNLTGIINTDNFDGYFQAKYMACNKGDTIFWNATQYIKADSFLLMSFKKINSKWQLGFNSFPFTLTNSTEAIIKQDYSGETKGCDEMTTHDFLLICSANNFQSQEYWIGLSSNPKTNFFTVRDTFSSNENFQITYFIRDVNYPHDRVYTADVSDSTLYTFDINQSLKNKFTYDYIISKPELKSLIDSNWFSPSRMEDSEEERKIVVVKNVTVKYLFNCQPENRVYQSVFQFSDIDNDGYEEIYRFAISKGKIISLNIFEETSTGVTIFPSDDYTIKWIENTNYCKAILRMSLQKENLLARIN